MCYSQGNQFPLMLRPLMPLIIYKSHCYLFLNATCHKKNFFLREKSKIITRQKFALDFEDEVQTFIFMLTSNMNSKMEFIPSKGVGFVLFPSFLNG